MLLTNRPVTYQGLPQNFFTPLTLDGFPRAREIAYNQELAVEIGLADEFRADLFERISGSSKARLSGIALAYAGHQFGHFVPQLGDGRALLIDQHPDREGRLVDIQLKGSGPTPFSRRGDGKSALGPVLREYLISEAMHHLGVPTTRALLAVATGETVWRGEDQPGGIFARVASSHVRIGSFEYWAARRNSDAIETLRDWVIARHYPEISNDSDPSEALLDRFIGRYVDLIADWLGVGFIHGVMNTDNAALSGETLDFGPCAFMDEFRFDQVFSSIDRRGRYAYDQQPIIGQWNVARLADCLSLLQGGQGFTDVSAFKDLVADFKPRFETAWLRVMGAKLGITDPAAEDRQLIELWLTTLEEHRLDFTASFRMLANAVATGDQLDPEFDRFEFAWRQRLARNDQPQGEVVQNMERVNPIYIPRNHLVERAITQAYENDFGLFRQLSAIWRQPFTDQGLPETFIRRTSQDERVTQTFCGT